MADIGRNIAKGLFYLVAMVLLVWTSSLTVSFVANALPGQFFLVPYLALVVFDGGMIAWLFVFLRHAEGAGQRATAIATCLIDFIGVGLMVAAEILLGGQTLTAVPANLGTYAIWGIAAWTVLNVLAVLVFHLSDPESIKQMAIQNEKDAIWKGALAQLASMRAQNSNRLHHEIGKRMFDDMLAELDVNGNGVPDALEQPRQLPPPAPSPELNGFRSHMDNKRTDAASPVSPLTELRKRYSVHDTNTHRDVFECDDLSEAVVEAQKREVLDHQHVIWDNHDKNANFPLYGIGEIFEADGRSRADFPPTRQ